MVKKSLNESSEGHDRATEKTTKERVAKESADGGNAVELTLKYGRETISPELLKRLERDWDNRAMDYNRINFDNVFTAFECDIPLAVTHWRISKILDGISICSNQLGICNGISGEDVPKKIYPALANGGGEKKNIDVRFSDPTDPTKKSEYQASLSDFAHFVDLIKANRDVGPYKKDLKTLAFEYFSQSENGKAGAQPINVKVPDKDGKLQDLDLLYEKFNPRDDYSKIDISGYLRHVESTDVQMGLQLMSDWRYNCEGHRELGGHVLQVPMGSGPTDVLFIPLSGRLAADITLGDLQKQENKGMMGQPQEVAEVDEEETGASIRFNMPELKQRQQGGDIRKVQKTTRMKKAMCGLTLDEDAYAQKEKGVDDEKKEKKDQTEVTKIYLCGKNLDGKVIRGMKARHRDVMKNLRGSELTKEEASDLVMTDVIIPCVLNNPNDWLSALADVYGMGGSNAAANMMQMREKFKGFEVHITCRDMEDPPNFPFKENTFHSYNELEVYICKRVSFGHVDQPNVEGFVNKMKDAARQGADATNNEFAKEKIDEEEGKILYEIFERLFAEKTDEYVGEYIKSGSSVEFDRKFNKRNVKVTFAAISEEALARELEKDTGSMNELFINLFGFEERNFGEDGLMAETLALTIEKLSESERKKIKK